MAYFVEKVPDLRLSDVDELIRETAMDNSNGQKIMEYLRRKRGGARTRLYDGSDNPIRFRLDHLQPVTVPPTSNINNNSARELSPAQSPAAADEADPANVGLIQPLAELSVENRLATFISPGRLSAVGGARNSRATILSSPTGKSTVHVSPIASVKPTTNLQKQILLQQYKRRNEMKCEALRHAAHLASSTPIAGEQSERSGQNLLNIRETISPILDEQVPGTPSHTPIRTSHPIESVATIQTPVPATQDVPDGTEQRNDRENTPPRDQNPLVVIPETPSPVRRSPRKQSTTLSGLSLAHRAHVTVVPLSNLMSGSVEGRESASSPFRRSILKNRNYVPSPRNRVSFSEKLTTVREISPQVPSDDSDLTSDESEREQDNQRHSRSRTSDRGMELRRSRLSFDFEPEPGPVSPSWSPDSVVQQAVSRCKNKRSHEPEQIQNQHQPSAGVEANVREEAESAQHSRRLFRQGRSNAFDDGGCIDEESPSRISANMAHLRTRQSTNGDPVRTEGQLFRSPVKTWSNRTNRNQVNMIMEDWDEETTTRMEVDNENGEAGGGEEAQGTITETIAITNVATPRTVVMDIFDPPSAFCDDNDNDDDDSNQQNTDQEASNDRDPIQPGSPAANGTASSRKRKQDNMHVPNNETEQAAIPSRKQSKQSQTVNTPVQVLQHSERLISVHSPNDHVPLDMCQAVDMIHSKVNSELLDPGPGDPEGERRTTIINLPDRRITKSKVNADTEMYFKTVETTCSQEGAKNKKRKQRRKLFAPEITESTRNDEELGPIPSPEPLPITQELDSSQGQERSQSTQQSTKPLAVIVKRLSAITIARCTQTAAPEPDPEVLATTTVALEREEECENTVELPVLEKQNEEHSEKSDRTKEERKTSSNAVQLQKPRQIEREKSPNRNQSGPKKKKKKKPKTKASSPDETVYEPPNGMVQKYLKDVSNEIRQQIESEGPRRSHRSRRLADEVLRNNPTSNRTDAPKYVMPTINDLLEYYERSEQTSKKGKAKEKGSNRAKPTEKKKHTESKEKDVSAKVSEKTEKKGRGRPKNQIIQQEKFDPDGFRIPPVPSKEVPGPSAKQDSEKASRDEQSGMFSTSPSNHGEQGTSCDSGLSSAVMTNDDVSNAAETNERSKDATSSKQPTKAHRHDRSSPSSSVPRSADAASPSGVDMLAEKRKAMDWMMMLMENQQHRAAGLPNVELQGFTHLSLEHLAFQQRKGIEYSFYIYSNKDNFGFLRVLPNVTKKTTLTMNCSLKFLILNGALKFIINGYEVNVVGGDFLMIPPNTTYSMANGPDTTLMFMIKTTLIEGQE